MMEWKPALQGTYGPNMNAFWWVRYTPLRNFNAKLCGKFHERDGQTYMYERKDENYIPLSINAGSIKISF